jgi:hypothetical protein
MAAKTRKLIARTTAAIRAAVQIGRAARYATLNGPLQQQLNEGRLIQASTYLRTLGVEDAGIRSFRSWYGRKVKAAYRDQHGHLNPQMAWAQIDGRWMHVCVYNPSDPALRAGVEAYPRLAAVVDFRALEVA